MRCIDDEEISIYDSNKAHWMKRATTKWNKNKKNPDYFFEDLLDQDDIRFNKQKKSFLVAWMIN